MPVPPSEEVALEARRALILHPADTVANVLEEVSAGDQVAARIGQQVVTLEAVEKIPFGFKISLAHVERGGVVYKYGEAIGKASQPIRRGALVHVHNLEGTRGRGDLQAAANAAKSGR